VSGTRQPVPALLLLSPHDDSRTGDNFDSLARWSKTVGPRMLAIGSPIFGSNPPPTPSDAWLFQRGLVSITFSSGLGTLTLPKAFPNGWLSLQVTNVPGFGYLTAGATAQAVSVTLSGGGSGTYIADVDALGW
jgi:hypothetical protein